MPEKIMPLLANITGGKSYKAHKYGLDHAERPYIDYGEDNVVWQETAETTPHRKYVSLERERKKVAESGEQLLTYFLDGSRRVFKVDDIAYPFSGGRSVIYPVIAGQIGVGCTKRRDRRLTCEKFKQELVISLPDIANADGKSGFFPAAVYKLNESPTLQALGIRFSAIISKILDTNDPDFGGITTWDAFREKVNELSQRTQNGGRGPGRASGSNEISVLSWRKFKRIINKATKNDDMFANRADFSKGECRLADALKHISPNDVCVVDIAKLPEDKQAFVFGDAVRTIYDLKLGEYDGEDGVQPPTRIVVFIDELNKYASKDAPKSSPILREILDVAERGRSLGVVLFGAEQSRSHIHQRVTGNCSTHAYGRTNSIETATKEYSSLPATYKNMLTRLEQGDYLIQNPIFRSLLKIRFPKPIYKQFK